jgi:hypothetical protein
MTAVEIANTSFFIAVVPSRVIQIKTPFVGVPLTVARRWLFTSYSLCECLHIMLITNGNFYRRPVKLQARGFPGEEQDVPGNGIGILAMRRDSMRCTDSSHIDGFTQVLRARK